MDLTYTPPAAVRAQRSLATRYVGALGVCLLGYALFGRAFAYIGAPPLFIGEIMLALGLLVALRMGQVRAVFASGTMKLWAVLLVWTALRAVPYAAQYKIDAIRDGMIVIYGLYAVVVASLLLAEPERLRELVGRYRTMVTVMLSIAWIVFIIAKQYTPTLPTLPWASDVEIISAKGGDMMVHMTGIVAFLMLGGQRSGWALAMAAVSTGLIMVSNRGGMVAFALGMTVIWLLRPPGTGASKFVYACTALLVVGLLAGPIQGLEINGGAGERSYSVEQMVENITSVFVSTDSGALDGTKTWRLTWWSQIVGYTFGGDYFWTGKGFGVNLAESDGFLVSGDENLRSPHNGHMTVLARGGVPGFLLWLALHLTWALAVFRAWFRARARDQRRWMALFAWLLGFWLAALVNASFDVFLEGPMGGIWLWSMMGVGLAAVRLRATHPTLLDPLDIALPESHGGPDPAPGPPPFAWG